MVDIRRKGRSPDLAVRQMEDPSGKYDAARERESVTEWANRLWRGSGQRDSAGRPEEGVYVFTEEGARVRRELGQVFTAPDGYVRRSPAQKLRFPPGYGRRIAGKIVLAVLAVALAAAGIALLVHMKVLGQ